MHHRANWLALAGAAWALASGGCGGGAPSVITECGLEVYTPNYATEVSHLFVWPGFPVRVHFLRDAQFTPARRAAALSGFDRWLAALGARFDYVETDDPANAEITVRFVDTTANGLTRMTTSGLTMLRARIEVGTQELDDLSISCIAAHEFGHALGIEGHSSTRGDLMYPVYTIGRPCGVTERDSNTLRTGYCDLLSRGAAPSRALPPEAPVRTFIIY